MLQHRGFPWKSSGIASSLSSAQWAPGRGAALFHSLMCSQCPEYGARTLNVLTSHINNSKENQQWQPQNPQLEENTAITKLHTAKNRSSGFYTDRQEPPGARGCVPGRPLAATQREWVLTISAQVSAGEQTAAAACSAYPGC